jgi:hypothetical protein
MLRVATSSFKNMDLPYFKAYCLDVVTMRSKNIEHTWMHCSDVVIFHSKSTIITYFMKPVYIMNTNTKTNLWWPRPSECGASEQHFKKVTEFWNMARCSIVEVDWRFLGSISLTSKKPGYFPMTTLHHIPEGCYLLIQSRENPNSNYQILVPWIRILVLEYINF